VVTQGSVSDALVKNRALIAEKNLEQEELQIAEQAIDVEPPVVDAPKSDGKLIVAEEVEIGHIGWPASMSNFLAFLPITLSYALMIHSAALDQSIGGKPCFPVFLHFYGGNWAFGIH
jgi:hypothetical protein